MVGFLPGAEHEEKELHRHFRAFHIRGEWFEERTVLREFIRDSFSGPEVNEGLDETPAHLRRSWKLS